MSAPVDFLIALAQALAAVSLYPRGHGSRNRALDDAFERLGELLQEEPIPQFSFLADEVVYGATPMRELRGWTWGRRLASLGIERLQFDATATRDAIEEFLGQVLARLTLQAIDTSEARQLRPSGIRYGLLDLSEGETADLITATMAFTLSEEADTIRWIHQQVRRDRRLPLVEAESVVRSLSVAMHGDQQMMVPLLAIREYDQYTTTHALNVSVLAMTLAEWLGHSPRDVRLFGLAGLLHDLGKVRVPKEILVKPGDLTPEERLVMNRHPVDGARLILASEQDLDVAAVVAYEHHVMLNGGGYPTFKYHRDCHYASKAVHVCDVYDALRTDRPYRASWSANRVLGYIEQHAGTEFDRAVALPFTHMMREWEPRIALIGEDEALSAYDGR